MIAVDIRLFGGFRSYTSDASIRIQFSSPVTVAEVKRQLEAALMRLRPELNGAALVRDSVLANSQEILKEEDRVAASCELAILPPVCGG